MDLPKNRKNATQRLLAELYLKLIGRFMKTAQSLDNSSFITNAIRKIFLTRRIAVTADMVPSQTKLKRFDRARLELIVEQKKLRDIGYGLYMISINYNQYQREHTIDEISSYFDRFYHQWLIPELVGNHANRASKRHLWPVVTSNTETNTAHRNGPIHYDRVKKGRNKPIYHQHAAVAVHPTHIEHFNKFLGLNKIDRDFDTNIIESIDIREADEFGILYCLKSYNEEVFTKKYGPIVEDLSTDENKSISRNDQLIKLLAEKIKGIDSNQVSTLQ